MAQLRQEREVILDFLETVLTATEDQLQELFAVSGDIGRAKSDFESRMGLFSIFLADLLYLKEGLPEKIVNIDLRERLTELADRAAVDQLIRMSDFLATIESNLKSNVNRQILTDVFALSGSKIVNGLS